MSDVVDVAEKVSKYVWEWLKIGETIPRGSVPETGITSSILATLSCSKDHANVFRFHDTKKPESVTGSDFCLAFLDGPCAGETYLVQAKKLYKKSSKTDIKKNRYEEFAKEVGGEYQFFKLIDYAARSNYTPLYAFYNSIYDQYFDDTGKDYSSIDIKYDSTNKSVLGVTITNAVEIGEYKSFIADRRAYPITFGQHLDFRSTVSLQQFFREASSGHWFERTPEANYKSPKRSYAIMTILGKLIVLKKMLSNYAKGGYTVEQVKNQFYTELLYGDFSKLTEDDNRHSLSQYEIEMLYSLRNWYGHGGIDRIVNLLFSLYDDRFRFSIFDYDETILPFFSNRDWNELSVKLLSAEYAPLIEIEQQGYDKDLDNLTSPTVNELIEESIEDFNRLTDVQQMALRETISTNFERLPILGITGNYEDRSGGFGSSGN